jgi:vitamin B12 transporter
MNARLLVKLVCVCTFGTSSLFGQKTDSMKVIHAEDVNISAFRVKSGMKELPQNIQVLGKNDIREIPNESVSDLLKKTAGIDIVEYPGFSSSIGMRGFAPTAHGSTYTLMLINGIPSGTQNVSTLDISNADQVEILKGPYSSFFGSGAMAGVINIVTPVSRDKIQGNIGLSAGSFDTYGIKANTGGRITNKLNFDLSVRLLQQQKDYKTGNRNLLGMTETEKEVMDTKSYGKVYQNTRYDKYNASIRVGYDFNEHWQANAYGTEFIANHILTNGNFWSTNGSSEKDIHRWSQSLSIDGTIGFNRIKFSPYYSNEAVQYYNSTSDTNYVSSRYKYKTYGFVLQDAIAIGNHNFIVGIDNYSQRYANNQWSGREIASAPSQPDYANIANGAFMQTRFRFMENRLNASLGLRYDLMYFKIYETVFIKSKNSTDTYRTLNPTIGLKYQIVRGLDFTGSAGTAFLAPDAFKKTGNYLSYGKVYRGNPNLKPEKSVSYDLGFSYSNQEEGIAAGITYFDNWQKGLMVYDRSNKDTITFKNADNTRMKGIEFSVAYDLGVIAGFKYSLKVYGNLTHMFTDKVTVDTIVSQMKNIRKDNASFGIEYNSLKAVVVRLNVRYIGHRYEDNFLYTYNSTLKKNVPVMDANGEPIRPALVDELVLKHPDFIVFDLSGKYTFVKKYTLELALQNLLDENYTEKDSYYMPGRTITISFNYSF